MSHYRNQLETWLKTVSVETDNVVDIGGASNPAKNRVAKFECKACDFIDSELEKPADGVNVLKADIQQYEQLRAVGLSYDLYDVAFCLEVFEYIYDPLTALSNIHTLMKPGGVLYITFPFVYPQHNPMEFDYLRYTPTGAYKLLKEAGFSIVETAYRTDRSGVLPTFYRADGMHAKGDSSITGVMIKAIAEKQ